MRALELYAGIGGFAVAAARAGVEVVCAVEQSDVALAVYRANFSHRAVEKNIAGFSPADFAAIDADLWWLSPPCQPFTKRGLRGDAADLRTRSLFRVLEAIKVVQPRAVALENVPGFVGSETHTALIEALRGYRVVEKLLCPTELGVPNKRLRYYLIAAREPNALREIAIERAPRPLASFLEDAVGAEYDVSPADLDRYHHAMSIIDPDGIASCFTSAYGRSPAKSGSFLATPRGARRFTPRELLRLFGFPPDFVVPAPTLERTYALIGNSLNVHAVRAILSAIR